MTDFDPDSVLTEEQRQRAAALIVAQGVLTLDDGSVRMPNNIATAERGRSIAVKASQYADALLDVAAYVVDGIRTAVLELDADPSGFADVANTHEKGFPREYPYRSGPYVVLGPEMFAPDFDYESREGHDEYPDVIQYRGAAYRMAEEEAVPEDSHTVELAEEGAAHAAAAESEGVL